MKRLFLILTIMLTVSLVAQEDSFFYEDDFMEEETSHGVSIATSGKISGGTYYIDETFNAYGELDFNALYEGSYLDINMDIDVNTDDLDNFYDFPLQNQQHNASMFFDTLYLRYYHRLFDLELGLLKPVWGNADGIHVIDFLNPIDFTDPFGPSYLDKKISQQMLKINIPFGDSSLLELVYMPKFEGDYIAMNGVWTPYYIKNMEDTIFNLLYAAALLENPATSASMIEPQAELLASTLNIQESDYFTDSQAAGRFTSTITNIDMGLTYYYGFLKQPTIDPEEVIKTGKLNLIYNRMHGFGLDVASQVGLFNLKGEVSYYLTDDIKGDDPAIVNNSLNYIVGFDINLPLNNVNLLLQGVGSTVINNNEITKMDPQYKDEYSDFMLMGRLSDNYLNETLFIELAGAYDFIYSDYMINPLVQYKVTDNLSLIAEYNYFGGDKDTDFGQFSDNDNIKMEIEYFF